MSYFIIAFIAGVILSGINIIFFKDIFDFNIIKIVAFVYITIIVIFSMDGLVALLVKMLPEKWFKKNGKIFKIFKWEKGFYQKIGIKKWKDKIPEWGKLANFSKRKLINPTNNEYVSKFIVESKYGEVIHFSSIFVGFLVIFILPLKVCLYVGLPVGIINALLNCPSLFILRYNRPKLETLYKLNMRKAFKKQNTVLTEQIENA
ncbi:MAG TPA: hypothetical protein DDW16_00220 [Clostridiales bacterium]|nr:hypothetical protein [Clostridiales bacterium]